MSDKKELSERDIITQFIIPAIEKAGWDIERQVREEVFFTDLMKQVEELMQAVLREAFE
jgi:type I site-specific restriction endonuclease